MDDERDKDVVSEFLERAGLRVTSLSSGPSVQSERCDDLLAEDECAKYLIEVKAFHDEDEVKREIGAGRIFETVRQHVYRKRVSKEIHKADKQLRGTARDHVGHFLLVALISRSKYDAHFMSEQIIGTLYGVGAITDEGPDGGRRRRRCLYFHENLFRKYPALDGAILIEPDGVMLCMNDFGHQIDLLRKSALASFLGSHNACYDQEIWERTTDCLVADFAADRTNEQGVLELLRQKYPERNLKLMHWHRWESIFRLDMKENRDGSL